MLIILALNMFYSEVSQSLFLSLNSQNGSFWITSKLVDQHFEKIGRCEILEPPLISSKIAIFLQIIVCLVLGPLTLRLEKNNFSIFFFFKYYLTKKKTINTYQKNNISKKKQNQTKNKTWQPLRRPNIYNAKHINIQCVILLDAFAELAWPYFNP